MSSELSAGIVMNSVLLGCKWQIYISGGWGGDYILLSEIQ